MKHNLQYFQEWLDKYINFERKADARLFRLETTERLADIFDHPELSYRTYHVAGSKGKGSLSKMLACILRETSDSPVGVYASPHVYDFRERIAESQNFFDDSIYNQTIAEFTAAIDALPDSTTCASWFELNAAFAFLTFKNAGCKDAVFEVGMGGRLDATNIIKPEICCITEIELEHTEFLGDTLEKIATEKAGIIKENTPVVIASQKNESVKNVFRQIASQKNAPIYFIEDLGKVGNIHYENNRMYFELTSELFARPLNVELKMLGDVQAYNALQAAITIKILHPEISEDLIERGLAKATLPGRFEIRDNLVLDGAHTLQSISECLSTFEKLFPNRPHNLLFAIAADKDISNIAPLFKNHFDKIYVTRPGDFKKSNLHATIAAFNSAGIDIIAGEDYQKLIKLALAESTETPLLAVGSFYLLDEINKIQSI